ncbi:SDR family NAD(P)-dependent oxidoreductase [Inquilinus limosus]|uniref:SDR family NAD(P)-dependent oxidoreductase n=1 Tax=Inquilinus limosus TaxID=171674 RepID=UPI003F15F111
MTAVPRAVVVTGASHGLGAALARHYAVPGVALALIGRNPARLAEVAESCRCRGAVVETAEIDVRDGARLGDFLRGFDARHPVAVVIANAGVEAGLAPGRGCEPEASVTAQLRINLEGAIATVSPLIEPMRRRRDGRIVLIASLAALMPLADQPAYSASKAGLVAWGEALLAWLRPDGIRVTIVCPGFIATGMSDRYRGPRPLQWSAERAAKHIAGRVAHGRAWVAFPWPLVWLIRLGRLAPRPIRAAFIDRFLRFEIDAHAL